MVEAYVVRISSRSFHWSFFSNRKTRGIYWFPTTDLIFFNDSPSVTTIFVERISEKYLQRFSKNGFRETKVIIIVQKYTK